VGTRSSRQAKTKSVWLGTGPGAGLHNAGYDIADAIIPGGSAFLASMVKQCTAS
jgi:hypothetical protein